MKYKELLNRCKSKPGWLGTREQKDLNAKLKYSSWVARQNEKNRGGS